MSVASSAPALASTAFAPPAASAAFAPPAMPTTPTTAIPSALASASASLALKPVGKSLRYHQYNIIPVASSSAKASPLTPAEREALFAERSAASKALAAAKKKTIDARKGEDSDLIKESQDTLAEAMTRQQTIQQRIKAANIRQRSTPKMELDELRRRYNVSTYTLGTIDKQLRGILLELDFRDYMKRCVFSHSSIVNRGRQKFNVALRRAFEVTLNKLLFYT